MSDATSNTTASENRYAFEHAGEPAGDRFDALAALYDESTRRHLAARGVGPGWRCLDVGAGGGSIARWLSEQVGPTGYVLATDLNTDYLERLAGGNLEVQRHNIVSDPLPEDAFDLAHTRLVLVHLPDREAVLERLIGALKPGGWLVAEEFDGRSMLPDATINPVESATPLISAIQQILANHGADTRYGRILPGRLHAHGLRDVAAEGRVLSWQGGSIGASIHRTNALHVRAEIIGSGLLTEGEFERDLARLGDPGVMIPSPIMWTVWGQRPAAM
jgi:SAM-dependent methyltransferase